MNTNGGVKKPSVVIAGAGVAGMAAAHVLADAGFDVTVFDSAQKTGGRCASYVDEELGHTIEHGIHGVFPRYQNLRKLWSDAGLTDAIYTRTRTTGLAGPDHAMHSTELAKSTGPTPFFLMSMVPRGVLRFRDYLFSLAILMRAYAAAGRTNERALDSTTFAGLLRDAGVSARMAALLLVPYVRNLAYARGDEVSARVAVEALGYYVLENADDVKAQWIDGGMVPVVFDPWQRSLEARGVQFRLGQPVRSLHFDGPRFVAFGLKESIADKDLGNVPCLLMRQVGAKYLGLNWEPSKRRLRAFDGACTHQGCRLAVQAQAQVSVFHCGCHGGEFDGDGNVLRAPPVRPLAVVPLTHDDAAAVWFVDEGDASAGDGLAPADHAVVALDIASFKAIFPRTLSLTPSTAGVPLLRTTSVAVLRMHFQARPEGPKWSGPDTGVFASTDFLDNFFALHTFQTEFQKLPDLFLECHVGESEYFGALEDDDIYDRAMDVLEAYFPSEGLRARLVRDKSRVLRHIDVFSLFAPGDCDRTPSVSAPDRPNLMLAGDWIHPDDPLNRSFFMERAAVTGIEAANAILRAAGMPDKQRPLQRPSAPWPARLLALPVVLSEKIRDGFRRAFRIDDN